MRRFTYGFCTSMRRRTSSSAIVVSDWRPEFKRLRYPIYLSLAEQIEVAIRSGQIRAGESLASHRQLADELGIHANTVSAAMKVVSRCGLIRWAGRCGTVVIELHDHTR